MYEDVLIHKAYLQKLESSLPDDVSDLDESSLPVPDDEDDEDELSDDDLDDSTDDLA